MSEKSIKVTDKRKFTAEGALKEEYRFLDDAGTASGSRAESEEGAAAGRGDGAGPATRADREPPAAPPPVAPAAPAAAPAGAGDERPALEIPDLGPRAAAPGFFDLLSVMVEPVPFYLGDAAMPDGSTGENLEAARFYIDLLDVLRQKTAGNLSLEEADALEDVLYRLRLRYVQKRG